MNTVLDDNKVFDCLDVKFVFGFLEQI
jgi:hypothetical protein